MSIYTKAGDTGYTSTKNRMRIPKNSPIFKLLGTLDEFSSALGLAKQKLPQTIKEVVEQLQEDIQLLSDEIAGGPKFTTHEKIESLEHAIDSIMSQLPEIKASIIPGDTEGGAALDLSRAIVRRAEREAVAASQMGGMSRDTVAWLNRISDMVYALARMADFSGGTEIAASTEPAASPTASAAKEKVEISPEEKIAIQGNQFCDKAEKLCDAVMEKARKEGLGVVTAVCDQGANLVMFKRDDSAFLVSIDVAINKAYTSASLKMTTEKVGQLTQPGEGLEGLQHTTGGKLILFGGGVPLYQNGQIVGALGVSGGTADQDKALAEYGAQLFEQSFT